MASVSDERRFTRRFPASHDPRVRLFCFPYAGGGASAYASWQQALGEEIHVCPVQLPGREERIFETSFQRIEPLVETLEAVLAEYLDVPFAFFGHSMGGFVAFELARALRRSSGAEPIHLFVSAARAPHTPSTLPELYDLPDDEFVAEVQAHYGGIPAEILENRDALELFVPRLKSDFGICDTYRYSDDRPLQSPITCFGSRDDASVTEAQLEAWGDETTSSFQLHWLPGDHLYLNPQRDSILSVVGRDLSRRDPS